MILQREPPPVLRPFVKKLWAAESSTRSAFGRERVLPTGEMHIVFRLGDHPVRLFDRPGDVVGRSLGHAVVGGARPAFYLRDKPECAGSVGVQLRPGAAEALFGDHADAFADRHLPLEDLWGQSAKRARERLLEAANPSARLDVLESILVERIRTARSPHPSVVWALDRFSTVPDVGHAVLQSGYSHRRFILLFRRAVGLTPKVYCRLLRFLKAIDRIQAQPTRPWVDVALVAGFSDQPHFNREFREFTGLTPEAYRALAPPQAFHVPLTPGTR